MSLVQAQLSASEAIVIKRWELVPGELRTPEPKAISFPNCPISCKTPNLTKKLGYPLRARDGREEPLELSIFTKRV